MDCLFSHVPFLRNRRRWNRGGGRSVNEFIARRTSIREWMVIISYPFPRCLIISSKCSALWAVNDTRINAAQVSTTRSAFVIFFFSCENRRSLYIFHNWSQREPATTTPSFPLASSPYISSRVAVIYRYLAAVIVTIFQLFDNNAKLNRGRADQTAIFIADYHPRNNANFPHLSRPSLLPPLETRN